MVTVPEYIEVPGPTETWYPPAQLVEPCIEQGETLFTAGLVWDGMTWADLTASLVTVWHGRLAQCNEQMKQLRQLIDEGRAGDGAANRGNGSFPELSLAGARRLGVFLATDTNSGFLP